MRRVAEVEIPAGFPQWGGPGEEGAQEERSALSVAMERGFSEFQTMCMEEGMEEEERATESLRKRPALRALTLALDLDEGAMRAHLRALVAVVRHRGGGRDAVPGLSAANAGCWGSARQYRFGVALSTVLRDAGMEEAARAPGGALHPALASFLVPCGGIVGAGNDSLYTGSADSPLVLHACVHDACGYALAHHALGPGYNYLGTSLTLSPTTSPLSCQAAGIMAAKACVHQLARERGD